MVSICVATYRRPERLQRLLTALGDLQFDGDVPAIEVCVADNDPEGSGCTVCEKVRPGYPWALSCEPEPRRGLSFARNRSVSMTSRRSDFTAFIDDDEIPERDWLQNLLDLQRQTGADAIGGPVLPAFECPPPRWAEEGGYFATRRLPTGTPLPFIATGNALVRSGVLRSVAGPFDPRFAHSGGEDTHLFLRLHRRGHRILWCDEAIAHEHVPRDRVNLSWVLRRGLRAYGMYSLCRRELDGWRSLPAAILKGLGRIGLGVLLLPVAIVRGQGSLVAGLLQISRGAGRIVGWFRRLPLEYGDSRPPVRPALPHRRRVR